MSKEQVKKDLIDILRFHVNAGFQGDQEILEEATDYMQDNYEEDEFVQEEWIISTIQYLRKNIVSGGRQEYFQRLDRAFNRLGEQGIIALHCAGYTISDGFEDANEIAAELREEGNIPIGYCFYHQQDLERLINDNGSKLFLAFGNYLAVPNTVQIGKIIVKTLQNEKFEISWSEKKDSRIAIVNMVWDKIYDDE